MNFRKTAILTLLFGLTAFVSRADMRPLITQANAAYQQGDYQKAVELYEQSGGEDGTSAAYYYNLGNAYYKCGLYPKAILNYERALLYDPSDEDARFNLEMAQERISDKIEPLEPFFLTQWVAEVRNLFSSDVWAITAVIAFIIFLVGAVIYVFVGKVSLRKAGFFVGLLALLVSIGANRFAADQKKHFTHRETAIIFAPTLTVKSSPSESGTDLFVLHEGTKVYLLDKVGQWSEIRLEDGNRGWIPTDTFEVI
ncbi:MAG: tetratricopeptide repeat protein [Porphyromonadaceae bacterium]|nr:tetratricopeptide repeat protein [Porphyromonadaceae bacterium]